MYSEASRVWKFEQVCDEKKSNALEVRAINLKYYFQEFSPIRTIVYGQINFTSFYRIFYQMPL